jgi:dephospho-CoA kinase
VHLVGLTGGIATGKSTVGQMLRDLGVPVLDADLAARHVVEPGDATLSELVSAFGPDILDPSGRLDRAAMRARIVADPQAKRTLERITHPAIRARIGTELAKLASEGHAIAVVEAALLIESGGYKAYPDLIVVTCDPEEQVRRVMSRDGQSEPQARGIIHTQMSMAEKATYATHVIRNDGDLQTLRHRTEAVWAGITP